MKIFLSYINNSKTHLKEFEVAEGSTVQDLLEHNEVRHLIKKQQNHDYKIGVNGEG
jgi:putative ubiquitin-RnfH superfamily antitoxin RatB of RatAB toxin-antitoxin module